MNEKGIQHMNEKLPLRWIFGPLLPLRAPQVPAQLGAGRESMLVEPGVGTPSTGVLDSPAAATVPLSVPSYFSTRLTFTDTSSVSPPPPEYRVPWVGVASR